eukprot:CAMPEP_0175240322 /NCGR_PEP_ID=MMETSP0093-20121207/29995_1 /TAXON_ID=311494 /ORGANISM="Alexandrium monilatum, Strain CCMP3105" /LENGTH=162 /DNA_ID=CAMNT_0016534367 /DNA_START=11 /DNA_END=497 /DNA_ORIENTATION=-
MRSQRGGAAQSSGQASSSCGAMPAPRAQLAQAKASSQAVLAEAKANPAVPRGSVRSHPQPLEWVASLPPGLLERLLQGVEDGVRVVQQSVLSGIPGNASQPAGTTTTVAAAATVRIASTATFARGGRNQEARTGKNPTLDPGRTSSKLCTSPSESEEPRSFW